MKSLRLLLVLGVSLASPGLAHSVQGEDLDALVGLWGAERVFGPEVRGPLVLRGNDERWTAEIQGHSAPVEVSDGRVSFRLPGERGSFEGQFSDEVLRGHWIQPVGRIVGYSFATPIVLEKTAGGVWLGSVEPADDRLSIYVELRRTTDGEVHARMRSPERNSGLRFDLGRVERAGRELLFRDYAGSDVLFRGRVSESGATWSFELPGRSAVFELTRRGRDEAAGFYPRDSGASPYAYEIPLAQADGWPTAHANEVGLDATSLEAMVQSVLDTEYETRATPYVQGILVARRGQLVLDEYFYGFHRDRPHDTRSSSKSLTALLVGIAMDRGAPLETSTSVLELFADQTDLDHVDDHKRALTIEHLLTMSSGFDCDDDDGSTPGNEDRMQSQEGQPDWIRYTLDLPMARAPGESAVYCTAGINLLGAAIERATGRGLAEFVAQEYAQPLDVQRYHLNLSPTGRPYMGGGIQFRPRDHLKLGQLLVDKGRWRGRQVVSAAWIERATAAHASIHEPDDYGYGIWRTTLSAGEQDYEVVYASGNGGQFVIAIPSLELVVLFTGGNYMNFPTWVRFLRELVPTYVLAAVRDA